MLRRISGLLATGAVAVLALTACSTGQAATTPAPAAGGSSGAAASPTDPATVLSAANIDAVIRTYPGEVTKLPTTFGTATKGALKIGWSSPRTANELVGRLGAALKDEVAAMGGSFVSYDANGDPAAQVGQVQQLVNDGVSAIVVWPLDATALKPSFKLAKAAGIPILAMEVTPDGSTAIGDVTGQIIYGRDVHAYVAATLMSQLFPGGQYAAAKFAVPVPSINYYAERATFWADKAGMKSVGTFDNPSDDVAGGESMAGPVLSKYPDLAGVLAYNDSTALGTMAAARAAGRTLVAFGMNGEDAGVDGVAGGKIAFSIQPPVLDWAKQLVAGAYLAKAGTTIPKTVFAGVGTVLTAETVAGAKKMGDLITAAYGS